MIASAECQGSQHYSHGYHLGSMLSEQVFTAVETWRKNDKENLSSMKNNRVLDNGVAEEMPHDDSIPDKCGTLGEETLPVQQAL